MGLFSAYFFDSCIETFLNSFKSFSNSSVAFLALAPAALTPFSVSDYDSDQKFSNSELIFQISSFMIFFPEMRMQPDLEVEPPIDLQKVLEGIIFTVTAALLSNSFYPECITLLFRPMLVWFF